MSDEWPKERNQFGGNGQLALGHFGSSDEAAIETANDRGGEQPRRRSTKATNDRGGEQPRRRATKMTGDQWPLWGSGRFVRRTIGPLRWQSLSFLDTELVREE